MGVWLVADLPYMLGVPRPSPELRVVGRSFLDISGRRHAGKQRPGDVFPAGEPHGRASALYRAGITLLLRAIELIQFSGPKGRAATPAFENLMLSDRRSDI
jgi:hypothetical protein